MADKGPKNHVLLTQVIVKNIPCVSGQATIHAANQLRSIQGGVFLHSGASGDAGCQSALGQGIRRHAHLTLHENARTAAHDGFGHNPVSAYLSGLGTHPKRA